MLLTEIEAGRLNQEKRIKKQLETAPCIRDLNIAERLKGLRDFNWRRVDDDEMMMIIKMTTEMVLDFLGLHLLHLMIFHCIILPYHHFWYLMATKLDERQLLEKKLQLQKKLNSLKIRQGVFRSWMSEFFHTFLCRPWAYLTIQSC